MALNNKQRAFIEHYLVTWNASEAARRAGYSPRSARVNGPRMLSNAAISDEITRRLAELKMSTDEVLLRLAEHARGTMADFINPKTGTIDLVKAEKAGKLNLIKSFRRSTGKTRTVSIELYDAQNALVQIGRTHGMFVDKVAPTDPTGKREYQPASEEERARAAQELAEWRQKQLEALAAQSESGLNATPTPPTS